MTPNTPQLIPPAPNSNSPVNMTILDITEGEVEVLPGSPLPVGVSETGRGLNFALFSKHATTVHLVLFASGQHEPVLELPLDSARNRTGHIWHIHVTGLPSGTRYGWRLDRAPGGRDRFHQFNPKNVLLDPCARAVTGGSRWGQVYQRSGENGGGARVRHRSLYVTSEFDWQYVAPPRISMTDKIIYELHVRGFTRHPSSGVAQPGTYLGLIEKIPYLKELGITTVELLPVYEFDENEDVGVNPLTGERLVNYWGYNPIGFFAPKAAFAAEGHNGGQVAEFKTLVRELHRAGIEVFLDVVFNHTAEGSHGPTYSFRGIDNSVYYLLDPVTGKYLDYSGCGNTVNCNQPVVREMILHALRYWVAEMHIDGFRFDLASILGRGQNGEVLPNAPLLERIACDPVLADTTIIAEAWDAAGLYQVGSFPSWGRWAEWNSEFRDDVRRFLAGNGAPEALATRLAGSSDLYQSSGRSPSHSINFVTCHDGFTLADLVSYNHKHNEANGQNNQDGGNHNWSWNCGLEGVTTDAGVLRLRRQQVKTFLTLLMLSQGTPMLLAGDELGRTQQGNNNAYCQDNAVSWIDWGMLERNADLFRFAKGVIAFRKAHPVLRRANFFRGAQEACACPDVTWHGTHLNEPRWGSGAHVLAMHLAGTHAPRPDRDVYLAINSSDHDLSFEVPPPPAGTRWLQVIDTSQPSPLDIADPGSEPEFSGAHSRVKAHSCVVLRSG